MKKIVTLLAWRYLYGTQHEKSIAIMVKICFVGILIGTFSLALIFCVMRGIEQTTHEKLRGIHAHATISAQGQELDFEHLSTVLHHEFPHVTAFGPSLIKQAIIQSESCDNIANVIILKAVDPTLESSISSIQEKIILAIDQKTLTSTLKDNYILIGKGLAEQLSVVPGDAITLLYTPDESTQGKKITFQHKILRIGGVFNTGIDEFDSGLAFSSLNLAHQLWPDNGITHVNLVLAKNAPEEKIIQNLKDRIGLSVSSWKDLYPALVSALKLEKYAMFFIIALITLVGCTNIISLMFMHIVQKQSDIALLAAMGMQTYELRSIFLLVGTSIACAGSCAGLLLAALCGLLLQHYPFITLPDAYYTSHLPISLEWHLFLIVLCVVMMLSTLATWIPVRKIGTSSIAHILRNEA